MAKKEAHKRKRTANFPLIFWEGLRDRCQAAADEDFNGNLTTYLNSLALSDVKKREAKAKK